MSSAHLARCCCDTACYPAECETVEALAPPEDMTAHPVLRTYLEMWGYGVGSAGTNTRLTALVTCTRLGDRWVYCYSDGSDTGGQSDACCTDPHPLEDPAEIDTPSNYYNLTQGWWFSEGVNCFHGVQPIGLRSLRVVIDYAAHSAPQVERTSPCWRIRWLARLSGTLHSVEGATIPWSEWVGGYAMLENPSFGTGAPVEWAASPAHGMYAPLFLHDESLHCQALTNRWYDGGIAGYLASDCGVADGADAADAGYFWRGVNPGWGCTPFVPPAVCPVSYTLSTQSQYPDCITAPPCKHLSNTLFAWVQ